jgi:hypothetical protein
MLSNTAAFLVLIGLSLLTSLGIYALISLSLRNLLGEILRMSAGTIFFARSLLICLMCVSLSDAIGQQFSLKGDAAFMEYIWKIAEGLSRLFLHTWLFLLGYLVLITVIVAVRGGRNE